MDHLFRQRRLSVPKRTSELVALVAVSCTLFLFLHTRDLSTKLRRMEGKLNDDITGYNHLTEYLSARLIEFCGDPRAGSYLGQRISLAIQRGNAASILGTLPYSYIDEFSEMYRL